MSLGVRLNSFGPAYCFTTLFNVFWFWAPSRIQTIPFSSNPQGLSRALSTVGALLRTPVFQLSGGPIIRGVPYIKESVTSAPMLFSIFFTPQDFHIYWFPPAMAQWLGAEFTIFRHWRSEGHQGLLPIQLW